MATGNLSKQVAMIGDAALKNDHAAVATIRNDLVLEQGLAHPCTHVTVIITELNNHIGYLAGMMTPDLGNKVLQLFHVEHPYFGAHIPSEMQEAYEIGQKFGKEYAKAQQSEAERAKKAAYAAQNGVMLPESDEAVTSDDARKIIAVAKAKREALEAKETILKGLLMATKGTPHEPELEAISKIIAMRTAAAEEDDLKAIQVDDEDDF